MSMKAIVVRELGGPEVLRLEEVARPHPGPGEVVLRVHASGVNFSDTERRRGVYLAVDLPWIPGGEAAGVVVGVGEGVDEDLLGRRVAALGSATYAELMIAQAEALIPLPDEVSFEQGAAFPIQGLTAYHTVLTLGRVRPGATVLVHAAAGGVGLLAIQIARRAGARVLGTVSSAAKAALVIEAGADEALAYGPDLAGMVRERTGGHGVDLVLDSVGLATQAASLAMLAPFGHLVHFGSASGSPAPVDPEDLYERSLTVSAYWLRTAHPRELMRRAVGDLLGWIVDGSLRLPISRVLPLAEAAEAHRALEARETHGKLLLAVP